MQKIAIDVSTLGQGLFYPKARTGVYRVVDEICRAALANQNIETLIAAPEYLAETLLHFSKEFPKTPQNIHNSKDDFLGNVEKIFLQNFDSQSVMAKAIRAVFYKFAKYQDFSTQKLADLDLYHSPYGSFPKVIQESKKIKKVITIHDLIEITHPQYFSGKGSHVISEMLASLTPDTHAVCISEATRQVFLEHSQIPENQTHIVPLAAEPAIFYPCNDEKVIAQTRQEYDIPLDAPYLLSIATLEPRKNIAHTIRCFLQMAEQQHINDLYLVLVGVKGWQFGDIFEELHVSESLRSRIVLTGYVPDQALAPLYSGALGFLFMSLVEGFGLPPLEAMQCGVPVIVSNSSSLPEVVGDAGLMINPTDADALSEAMLQVYNDGQLRANLAQKSLERAKHFSWQKFAEGYQKIYTFI